MTKTPKNAAQTPSALETGSLSALRAEDPEVGNIISVCLPRPIQTAALALASVALEASRVHRITTDVTIGTIRIKWWLEAIDEIYEGKPPRKHPCVLALANALERHQLSRGFLDAMVESYGMDLDGLRALSWDEASALFAARYGNLFRLFLETQDIRHASAHAMANHLGVAYGLWRALPGLGSINHIPWMAKAPAEPNWLVQALTHLDLVDQALRSNGPAVHRKWTGALARYLRHGILLVAQDQLPKAVAQQKASAFGLWRRTF